MRSQHFEQAEALLLILLLLLNQLLDELLELRLARLRDQWLFKQDLVDQAVDVSSVQEQVVFGKQSSNISWRLMARKWSLY